MSVTLEAARKVLSFQGDTTYGIDGGHFVSCLLRAMFAADPENRERLKNEYPDLVAAVDEFKRGGVESLRGLVKSQMDHRDRGLDFDDAMWDER